MLPALRLILTIAIASALWAILPVSVHAQDLTWELRGGRWQQVDNPTGVATPDETLDRVETMLQNKQHESARRLAISWIKSRRPKSGTEGQRSKLIAPTLNRDRAIYLLGMANFHVGHRIISFYNFDELLDYYPASRYFYPALQQQYEIADQFLRGYKRKFLGLRILGAETEATEMLYRIQQRAPGSPIAEKALLRTADYYYASGQFDLAADAYAAYARSYPRSPYQARVRLRETAAGAAEDGMEVSVRPIAANNASTYAADLAREILSTHRGGTVLVVFQPFAATANAYREVSRVSEEAEASSCRSRSRSACPVRTPERMSRATASRSATCGLARM